MDTTPRPLPLIHIKPHARNARFRNNIFVCSGNDSDNRFVAQTGEVSNAFVGNNYYNPEGSYHFLRANVRYESFTDWQAQHDQVEGSMYNPTGSAGVDPMLKDPDSAGTLNSTSQPWALPGLKLRDRSPMPHSRLNLWKYYQLPNHDFFGTRPAEVAEYRAVGNQSKVRS